MGTYGLDDEKQLNDTCDELKSGLIEYLQCKNHITYSFVGHLYLNYRPLYVTLTNHK